MLHRAGQSRLHAPPCRPEPAPCSTVPARAGSMLHRAGQSRLDAPASRRRPNLNGCPDAARISLTSSSAHLSKPIFDRPPRIELAGVLLIVLEFDAGSEVIAAVFSDSPSES